MSLFDVPQEVLDARPHGAKDFDFLQGRWLIHHKKLLGWKNCEDFDMNAALQSFFDGVDEHEKGAKIWNDCLDESK